MINGFEYEVLTALNPMSTTMLQSDSVSVILAHFNRHRFLRASAESILGQSHAPLQLYVVDDCSPNRKWLDELKPLLTDNRLSIARCLENVGHYRIKNFVIDMCRTDWIAFQDADDISVQNRLQRQIEVARTSCSEVVSCSCISIDENDVALGTLRTPSHPKFSSRLFGKRFLMLNGGMLISRASFFAVDGFDGTTHVGADSDLSTELSNSCAFGTSASRSTFAESGLIL